MRINKSLITQTGTGGGGSGTVTSVGLSVSVPTGLSQSVTGSPVTTSGTIAISLSFAAGYAIPTTVKQSEWDDAYTWVAAFPTQTGNAGKYLKTDGSNLIWTSLVSPAYGTTGQVQMNNGGDLYANADLYFDITNSRLGIGVGGTYIHKTLVVHTTNANNQFLLSGTAPGVEFGDNTSGTFTYRAQIGMATSSGHFATNSVAGDLVHWVDTGKNMLWAINSVEKIKLLSTGQFKLAGYTSTSSFTGTAAGYLAFDSSGNILSAAAPSGGTPAGSNTQIQYNNSGAFGASSAFTYVDSTGQLSLRKDQNASTVINLSNYTSGASTSIALLLWSSAGSIGQIGKYSATTTTYKTITANSTYVYHGGSGAGAGDLHLFTDVNGIVFTAGGFTQPHMKLFSSGNFAINSSTDSGYRFYVNGTTYLANYVYFGNFQYIGRSDMIIGSGNVTALALRSGSTLNFAPNTTWMATMTDAGMSIGTSSNPNANSILELVSTTKGFLPPRMTNAQRTAIGTPTVGLIVYCTDATEGLYIYKSSGWTFII